MALSGCVSRPYLAIPGTELSADVIAFEGVSKQSCELLMKPGRLKCVLCNRLGPIITNVETNEDINGLYNLTNVDTSVDGMGCTWRAGFERQTDWCPKFHRSRFGGN